MGRRACGISACIAGVAVAVLMWGCGRDAGEKIVARVGHAPITAGMVAHWMEVFAPEHVVPDSPRYGACVARQEKRTPERARSQLKNECRDQFVALQARALDFLISLQWQIGEAADMHMGVSRQATRVRLEQMRAGVRNGATEFPERLNETGRNVADAELEATAQVASARILQVLNQRQPPVAQSAINTHYAQHRRSYYRRERRRFYIVEEIQSLAEAREARRKIMHGSESIAKNSVYEWREQPAATTMLGRPELTQAVFAAKPYRLTQPVRSSGGYYLIEVTQIIPAGTESLASVADAIRQKLSAKAARAALGSFVAAWRAKWRARTSCEPSYVVPRCRQYRGSRPAEDPFELA